MSDWLSALSALSTISGEAPDSILVTVAMVEGSGPRAAGAKMRVGLHGQVDTIGGGHLELRAVEMAKTMLMTGDKATRIERLALGPSLGQCCGGVVYLAFEAVHAATPWWQQLQQRRQHDSWRVSAVGGQATALHDADGAWLAGSSAGLPQDFSRARGTHLMHDAAGQRWLVDACLAPRAHLVLFGAGHVGAAIVRALAHLPCTVTWVDEREDMFPAQIPDNARVVASDMPEEQVAVAPPGASFLVMTHSHALDQRLTQAIMARDDTGWFGLIGSLTKRRQFEHRLRARGVDEQRIAAMVCPIGMPGIKGKEPAVIAASVACQLLQVWEAAADAAADTAHAALPSPRQQRAIYSI